MAQILEKYFMAQIFEKYFILTNIFGPIRAAVT